MKDQNDSAATLRKSPCAYTNGAETIFCRMPNMTKRCSFLRRTMHAAICVFLVAGVTDTTWAGDVFYEVWRNTTCDLTSATRVGQWLTNTSFNDDNVTPGQQYYYWTRGLETQTVHNSWVNLSFSQEEWFTCPTAIERGKSSPIKAKVRLGGGIFGPQTASLYSQVREEDVFFNDTIDDWSAGPFFVGVTSDVTREWTRDVQIAPMEPLTGTAEVYYRSKFGNSLWLPTSVIGVEMKNGLDAGPSGLSVAAQANSNVLTWSPTATNTSFSLPSHTPRYAALIISSSDPYSGYAADMKDAMLATDRVFWRDENIVALEDPTRQQVQDSIATLGQNADFFLFAYAGHGAKNGDFVQGAAESVPPALTTRDEAIVWTGNDPTRGRVEAWITDDELTSWLGALDCPALSVIQSCYSGGFWNGGDEGDLDRLPLSSLIAACPEDETADVSTTLWADLMEGARLGSADTSGDGIVTLGEWYSFAKTGDSLMFGNLNDLQLFAVAEPSTIVLLAAGAIGFLAYAWRRRRMARG